MIETEEKIVEVKKQVYKTMKCDICGKEIKEGDKYFSVTTGHRRWGNDSIDSIECQELCSEECCGIKFNKYINNAKYTDRIEIEVEENYGR